MANVSRDNLWVLVLGYVRYSMGRMSTAPSMASEFVRMYWRNFADDQRAQIAREVRQELDACTRSGTKLGMGCDHEVWERLAEWCEARLSTPHGQAPGSEGGG